MFMIFALWTKPQKLLPLLFYYCCICCKSPESESQLYGPIQLTNSSCTIWPQIQNLSKNDRFIKTTVNIQDQRQHHQLSREAPWTVGDQETVETGGWGGHLAPEVVFVMMAVVLMILWWWWWMWLKPATVDIGHCHLWHYHPHQCHHHHHPHQCHHHHYPHATHLGSLALAWGQERLEYSALLLKFGNA